MDTSQFVGDYDIKASVVNLPFGVYTLIAPNNPRRVALIFEFVLGAFTIWPMGPIPAGSNGIPMSNTSYIREYLWQDHFALATVEWYGLSGAGSSVAVIEVIWSPKR